MTAANKTYKRDQGGKFARVNTLVHKIALAKAQGVNHVEPGPSKKVPPAWGAINGTNAKADGKKIYDMKKAGQFKDDHEVYLACKKLVAQYKKKHPSDKNAATANQIHNAYKRHEYDETGQVMLLGEVKGKVDPNGPGGTPGGTPSGVTPKPATGKKAVGATKSGISLVSSDKFDSPGSLKPTGKTLGGVTGAKVYVDSKGQEWVVKSPKAGSNAYGNKNFLVDIEIAASRIQNKAGLPVPAMHSEEVDGKHSAVSKMYKGPNGGPVEEAFPKGKGLNLVDMNAEDILALQKNQVFDWLISNHDTHSGNFLSTDTGIVGIDKGQAFKFFGKDKLDYNYEPVSPLDGNVSVYQRIWRQFSQGKGDLFDPSEGELHGTIQRIQAIPDAEYRKALTPYAIKAAASGSISAPGTNKSEKVDNFLDAAVARKNSLQKDFDAYYAKVKGEHDTAVNVWGPPAKAPIKKAVKAPIKKAVPKATPKMPAGNGNSSINKTKGTNVQQITDLSVGDKFTMYGEEYTVIETGISGPMTHNQPYALAKDSDGDIAGKFWQSSIGSHNGDDAIKWLDAADGTSTPKSKSEAAAKKDDVWLPNGVVDHAKLEDKKQFVPVDVSFDEVQVGDIIKDTSEGDTYYFKVADKKPNALHIIDTKHGDSDTLSPITGQEWQSSKGFKVMDPVVGGGAPTTGSVTASDLAGQKVSNAYEVIPGDKITFNDGTKTMDLTVTQVYPASKYINAKKDTGGVVQIKGHHFSAGMVTFSEPHVTKENFVEYGGALNVHDKVVVLNGYGIPSYGTVESANAIDGAAYISWDADPDGDWTEYVQTSKVGSNDFIWVDDPQDPTGPALGLVSEQPVGAPETSTPRVEKKIGAKAKPDDVSVGDVLHLDFEGRWALIPALLFVALEKVNSGNGFKWNGKLVPSGQGYVLYESDFLENGVTYGKLPDKSPGAIAQNMSDISDGDTVTLHDPDGDIELNIVNTWDKPSMHKAVDQDGTYVWVGSKDVDDGSVSFVDAVALPKDVQDALAGKAPAKPPSLVKKAAVKKVAKKAVSAQPSTGVGAQPISQVTPNLPPPSSATTAGGSKTTGKPATFDSLNVGDVYHIPNGKMQKVIAKTDTEFTAKSVSGNEHAYPKEKFDTFAANNGVLLGYPPGQNPLEPAPSLAELSKDDTVLAPQDPFEPNKPSEKFQIVEVANGKVKYKPAGQAGAAYSTLTEVEWNEQAKGWKKLAGQSDWEKYSLGIISWEEYQDSVEAKHTAKLHAPEGPAAPGQASPAKKFVSAKEAAGVKVGKVVGDKVVETKAPPPWSAIAGGHPDVKALGQQIYDMKKQGAFESDVPDMWKACGKIFRDYKKANPNAPKDITANQVRNAARRLEFDATGAVIWVTEAQKTAQVVGNIQTGKSAVAHVPIVTRTNKVDYMPLTAFGDVKQPAGSYRNPHNFGKTYDVTKEMASFGTGISPQESSSYSNAQTSSIKSYTGGGYNAINSHLRSGSVQMGNSASLDNHVKNIDAAMDKSEPLKDWTIVTRGVGGGYDFGIPHHNYSLDDVRAQIGKTLENKGYSSTSLGSNPAFGGKARVIYRLPPGLKALYVAGDSAGKKLSSCSSSERELILPRNLKLKIISADKHTDGLSYSFDVVVEVVGVGAD